MPHGGYHGTVKMGGRTVQQASRPDGRGGQTGGGRYRPQGYDEPKPSSQTAAELTKQIREQMKAAKEANTDSRSLLFSNFSMADEIHSTSLKISVHVRKTHKSKRWFVLSSN